MKFLIVLITSASLASAADLCMTTNANCGGSKTCCKGIKAGTCCDFNGFTNTQLLYTLPANSRGQGWTGEACTGSSKTFTNEPAQTICFNFPWPATAAKWLQGLSKGRRDADENCAEPNFASYTLDGVEHEVNIPEGQAAQVTEWIKVGEWQKLAALEQ